jgi:hypothetical protein
MRGLLRFVMGAFAVLAVVAAVYGSWLVTTVDRDFAPRGTVGTLFLVLAAILSGLTFVTWRHSH